MTALPEDPHGTGSDVPPICKKCDLPHLRDGKRTCRAHLKSGKMCRQWPLNGSVVCKTHGGSAPQAKAAAAKRVERHFVEGKIGFLLKQQGIDMPKQHPLDGLLEVVRRSGGMMRLLEGMVGELGVDVDEEPQLWGMREDGSPMFKMPKNIYGRNHVGDGAPHVLVEMYHQWMMTYARACKLALDANIDERMVRQATLTSDLYFTAFRNSVQAAQLDPEQAKRFSVALAAELRKLAGPLDTLTAGG
jgi:hypothetical protein